MTLSTVSVVNELIRRASQATGIHHSRIYARRKSQRLVRIRWAIMHNLRTRQAWTFGEIGDHFGMDHGTALHGVRQAADLIQTDKWFAALSHHLAKP
jgi:chromosomal replication initiation ATPase DnaA